MTPERDRQVERIRRRRMRQEQNLFSRMPAAYAASRQQGQNLLQQAAGLSIVEWRVLWDLSEAGAMTIRDLAEIQRTDHSQLSRALPAMRKKGLVSVRRDASDGRQTLVEIAPAGQRAYEKAAPVMQRRRNALRATFSDEEIAGFIGMLDRLDEFWRQPIENILEVEPTE
ncbi:MAG: MarR family transcriptional regulator [Pseudomonadota bacterium]